MKELLGETGVSSGSMYHAFPGGKEELAATSIREEGLYGAQRIRKVLADAPTVAAAIGIIFEALRKELEASEFRLGCPIGVPATEAAAVSTAIQAATSKVFEAWIEAYRDGLVASGWGPSDAAEMSLVIVMTYEGAVTLSRALRSTKPISAASAQLIRHIGSASR